MKKLLLLSLFALCGLPQLKASHLMGGEITVQQISNDTYVAALIMYRDTTGINAASQVTLELELNGAIVQTLTAASVSSISGNLLPQYPYGVEVHLYVDTFTLNTPGAYTLSHLLCCRNNAIVNLSNPGGEFMFLSTDFEVFPNAANSTPFFIVPAAVFLPVNTPWQYNPLPFDLDGDSLSWSIDAPMGSNGYCAGFTQPSSDPSNPFSIDSITGTISWTADVVGNHVASIRVDEYRNGQWIGSIHRDMQYIVVNNTSGSPLIANNPNWTTNANGVPTFQAYYGTPIQIQFLGQHPNPMASLDMEDYGELPAMNHPDYSFNYTATGNGAEILGVLDWLPGLSDFRTEPYAIVMRISDNLFTFDALFEINVSSNIGLVEEQYNRMTLYPNPAQDFVNIEIPRKTASDATLNVYSINGTLIQSNALETFGAGQNYILVPTNEWNSGMYMIEITTEDQTYHERVIIR